MLEAFDALAPLPIGPTPETASNRVHQRRQLRSGEHEAQLVNPTTIGVEGPHQKRVGRAGRGCEAWRGRRPR
jgi:hypothetical protein